MFLLALTIKAQQDTTKRFNWTVLPVVYYTPEAGLAYGGGGAVTYLFKDSKRPSQATFGAVHTTLNQLLLYANYRAFWNKDKYLSYGEVGYYKYEYIFYEIGSKSTLENERFYNVNFPRLRASFLRKIDRDFYLGLRWWFDAYNIQNLNDSGEVVGRGVVGGKGGNTSGIGVVTNYDSRDDQLFPQKGWFVEGVLLPHAYFMGSDFNFFKASADIAYYYPLKKDRMLFAFNAYAESNFGETPFQQLAMLGGDKQMRGYYQGRYRDEHALILQAEYRWMFWKRFGFAAFASAAKVGGLDEPYLSNKNHFSGGGGARFQLSKSSTLNLRLDAAYSDDGNFNFYLTFGEAF